MLGSHKCILPPTALNFRFCGFELLLGNVDFGDWDRGGQVGNVPCLCRWGPTQLFVWTIVCVCVGRLNSMDKVLRMLAFYLCVVLNFFGIGKFCFVSLFHMPSIFVRLCLWNVVPTPLRSECYKGCRPHTPFASRYGGYGTFGA